MAEAGSGAGRSCVPFFRKAVILDGERKQVSIAQCATISLSKPLPGRMLSWRSEPSVYARFFLGSPPLPWATFSTKATIERRMPPSSTFA
jgi:hypothetical protein